MFRRAGRLVLLGVLACGGGGCAILPFSGEGFGGGSATLGDAVSAATADSSEKVRAMDAGHAPAPVVEPEVEPEPIGRSLAPGEHPERESHATARRDPDPDRHRPLFGLVLGGGALGGAAYDGFSTLGITGGDYVTGRVRWDLLATMTSVEFNGENKLGKAFRDAMDLQIELDGRWYFTPGHTFVGVYALGGLATGTLFWDYAQPVPVVQDGQLTSVGDDRVNHFDGFLGAGTTLAQFRHVQVGGNVVMGLRLYGWHTFQGFENDELPPTGFARALVELEFR